ncbi:unnamed protein product [Pleuronectes platessa]|uniref:Uncharacterized protein n=1 Tax=Pleuronectes platessa TaxID=8262 RepID=A0A9N7YM09_PLEPL|nr:unnamed protein product [Pleuronectes platessa]
MADSQSLSIERVHLCTDTFSIDFLQDDAAWTDFPPPSPVEPRATRDGDLRSPHLHEHHVFNQVSVSSGHVPLLRQQPIGQLIRGSYIRGPTPPPLSFYSKVFCTVLLMHCGSSGPNQRSETKRLVCDGMFNLPRCQWGARQRDFQTPEVLQSAECYCLMMRRWVKYQYYKLPAVGLEMVTMETKALDDGVEGHEQQLGFKPGTFLL